MFLTKLLAHVITVEKSLEIFSSLTVDDSTKRQACKRSSPLVWRYSDNGEVISKILLNTTAVRTVSYRRNFSSSVLASSLVGTLKSALCESSYKMTTRSMYRTLQLSAELRFPNIFVIALASAHQRVLPIFVSFF